MILFVNQLNWIIDEQKQENAAQRPLLQLVISMQGFEFIGNVLF